MKKERFKLTPACYLVLIKDNKILLLRRFNTGYQDGNYSFVAGHLDGNESFRQAMVREAKEEAGIKISPEKLDVVHVLHRLNDKGGERLDIFLKTSEWEGEIKNMEPHKCDDLSWFPLDELPENTIPYIRQTINHVLNKRIYSELNF